MSHAHATRSRWILWGFMAMVAVLLFTEHRAHVLGLLPYLFLLACPLMHVFHHGHHHRHRPNDPKNDMRGPSGGASS